MSPEERGDDCVEVLLLSTYSWPMLGLQHIKRIDIPFASTTNPLSPCIEFLLLPRAESYIRPGISVLSSLISIKSSLFSVNAALLRNCSG